MSALLLIALLAPPIDWANHDYGFFTLRDGTAEMREYDADGGGLHDTQLWKLKAARSVKLGVRALTLVLIEARHHGARGTSRESILFRLFENGQEIGRGSVPTRTATVAVETEQIVTRWAVGAERFEQRWHLKGGKLMRMGDGRRAR